MIATSKWLAIVAVAFVAGSFIASPELRAFAANTVKSIDIVDGEVKTADLGSNAVTAAKVKDGEIKAAEIATDAVGAAELQGVTKLLFGQCVLTNSEKNRSIDPNDSMLVTCNISGVDVDDNVFATINGANTCFEEAGAGPNPNLVYVYVKNTCGTSDSLGSSARISILVYDK
jgi:hypothetical protein